MDGHEDREFRRELQAYLRRQLHVSREGEPILEDVRIVDSKNTVLIQLADMVAGTLRRHVEQEMNDAIEYRTMIHKRIEDVWNFGEGEGANIVRPSSYPEDPRARAPYGDSSDAGSL